MFVGIAAVGTVAASRAIVLLWMQCILLLTMNAQNFLFFIFFCQKNGQRLFNAWNNHSIENDIKHNSAVELHHIAIKPIRASVWWLYALVPRVDDSHVVNTMAIGLVALSALDGRRETDGHNYPVFVPKVVRKITAIRRKLHMTNHQIFH